jgi:hypothetical protein
VRNVDFSILLNSLLGAGGYEVSEFGESIHDHPNQVKFSVSQWQTHNKIYANVIPPPVWNARRFEQSSIFYIISLDLPASISEIKWLVSWFECDESLTW